MKKIITLFFISFIFCSFSVQKDNNWKAKTENAIFIHKAVKEMTDIMVHDIYSPPVASRTYAYISIAAYEAAHGGWPDHLSLAGQLHGLKPLPKPKPGKEYSYTLAAIKAMLTVGKAMVVSEERANQFYNAIEKEFRSFGMPSEVVKNSIAHGQAVAEHVLAWAALDNYKETRTFSKYAPTYEADKWKPTPPAYMKAVEPHWGKIRTFVIDSSRQFYPLPPTSFSTDKNSQFYKEAMEVRDIVKNLNQEQIEIANFWDCNPFKMNVNGHVMFASKKISPGGHWINIASQACQTASFDVIRTLETYACLSIAIADAFISCWEEKYRSNVIRPETYINQYIDGAWMPLLQTPPFPEYTSGHSVVSAAACVMLTRIFGDNFKYVDSTEIEFGLPPRRFTSFRQAAEEAAISRLYGGIHYRPAIENGMSVGFKLGYYISEKLTTKRN